MEYGFYGPEDRSQKTEVSTQLKSFYSDENKSYKVD